MSSEQLHPAVTPAESTTTKTTTSDTPTTTQDSVAASSTQPKDTPASSSATEPAANAASSQPAADTSHAEEREHDQSNDAATTLSGAKGDAAEAPPADKGTEQAHEAVTNAKSTDQNVDGVQQGSGEHAAATASGANGQATASPTVIHESAAKEGHADESPSASAPAAPASQPMAAATSSTGSAGGAASPSGTASPRATHSTPASTAATAAQKKFTSLNVTKRFLEKASPGSSPGLGPTKPAGLSPGLSQPSSRLSTATTASRLTAAKLSSGASKTAPAGWAQPASVTTPPLSSASPSRPSTGLPGPTPAGAAAQQAASTSTRLGALSSSATGERPSLRNATMRSMSPSAGLGSPSGGAGSGAVKPAPWAGVSRGGSSGPSSSGPGQAGVAPTGRGGSTLPTSDFPTAAEALQAKRQAEERERAAAAETAAKAEAALQHLDRFRGTHLGSGNHWDEMLEDDDGGLGEVVEFEDGTSYKVPATRNPAAKESDMVRGASSQGESVPVSKEERFKDVSHDRSWPPRQSGGGAAPASTTARPAAPWARSGERDVPPHLASRGTPTNLSIGASSISAQDLLPEVPSRSAFGGGPRSPTERVGGGGGGSYLRRESYGASTAPGTATSSRGPTTTPAIRAWGPLAQRQASLNPDAPKPAPPAPVTAPQGDGRPLPPHLAHAGHAAPAHIETRRAPSSSERDLPPHMRGMAAAQAPSAAPPSRSPYMGAAAGGPGSDAGYASSGTGPRSPQTPSAAQPAAAPPLQAVASRQRDDMLSAAERARKRRQEEEAAREAQKERALAKAKALEERIKREEEERRKEEERVKEEKERQMREREAKWEEQRAMQKQTQAQTQAAKAQARPQQLQQRPQPVSPSDEAVSWRRAAPTKQQQPAPVAPAAQQPPQTSPQQQRKGVSVTGPISVLQRPAPPVENTSEAPLTAPRPGRKAASSQTQAQAQTQTSSPEQTAPAKVEVAIPTGPRAGNQPRPLPTGPAADVSRTPAPRVEIIAPTDEGAKQHAAEAQVRRQEKAAQRAENRELPPSALKAPRSPQGPPSPSEAAGSVPRRTPSPQPNGPPSGPAQKGFDRPRPAMPESQVTRAEVPQDPAPVWNRFKVAIKPHPAPGTPGKPKLTAAQRKAEAARRKLEASFEAKAVYPLTWEPPLYNLSTKTLSRDEQLFPKKFNKGVVISPIGIPKGRLPTGLPTKVVLPPQQAAKSQAQPQQQVNGKRGKGGAAAELAPVKIGVTSPPATSPSAPQLTSPRRGKQSDGSMASVAPATQAKEVEAAITTGANGKLPPGLLSPPPTAPAAMRNRVAAPVEAHAVPMQTRSHAPSQPPFKAAQAPSLGPLDHPRPFLPGGGVALKGRRDSGSGVAFHRDEIRRQAESPSPMSFMVSSELPGTQKRDAAVGSSAPMTPAETGHLGTSSPNHAGAKKTTAVQTQTPLLPTPGDMSSSGTWGQGPLSTFSMLEARSSAGAGANAPGSDHIKNVWSQPEGGRGGREVRPTQNSLRDIVDDFPGTMSVSMNDLRADDGLTPGGGPEMGGAGKAGVQQAMSDSGTVPPGNPAAAARAALSGARSNGFATASTSPANIGSPVTHTTPVAPSRASHSPSVRSTTLSPAISGLAVDMSGASVGNGATTTSSVPSTAATSPHLGAGSTQSYGPTLPHHLQQQQAAASLAAVRRSAATAAPFVPSGGGSAAAGYGGYGAASATQSPNPFAGYGPGPGAAGGGGGYYSSGLASSRSPAGGASNHMVGLGMPGSVSGSGSASQRGGAGMYGGGAATSGAYGAGAFNPLGAPAGAAGYGGYQRVPSGGQGGLGGGGAGGAGAGAAAGGYRGSSAGYGTGAFGMSASTNTAGSPTIGGVGVSGAAGWPIDSTAAGGTNAGMGSPGMMHHLPHHLPHHQQHQHQQHAHAGAVNAAAGYGQHHGYGTSGFNASGAGVGAGTTPAAYGYGPLPHQQQQQRNGPTIIGSGRAGGYRGASGGVMGGGGGAHRGAAGTGAERGGVGGGGGMW